MKRIVLFLVIFSLLWMPACSKRSSSLGSLLPEEASAQDSDPSLSSNPTPSPTPTIEPTLVPTPQPLLFPDGSIHAVDELSVDLSSLRSDSLHDAALLLRHMPQLQEVQLGSDSDRPDGTAFRWGEMHSLQQLLPGVRIDYSFSIYGKQLSLSDRELDFSHIQIDDDGRALEEILPCMNACTYLDMDSCGVSNETMARIRDNYPEMEVVWRIWFGRECSVRTDCERILASSPTHCIIDANTRDLQYCTKVKYLDLGHNAGLHDFSFLENMPDLEVAILAISGLQDLTPVGKCVNLEYLEINSCMNGMDLTPLANCRKLHHLNICWLFNVTGFSALQELTELERLWIGKITKIPPEELEALRQALPNTIINVTELTGCGGSWRQNSDGSRTDRYELLRQQFDYDHYDESCSSFYNDPKYFTDPEEAMLYRKHPFS